MRMWDPGSVHMRRFIKLLVRAVPPCVTRRTAKDRIEGWTQRDEDMAFGLDEFEREWMGDDLPPEAQHLLMHMHRKLEEVLRECTPPKIPDSIQHAEFERIADAHGGYLDGMTGFIIHEDGRRERWGKP